jgi:hexosaminidase
LLLKTPVAADAKTIAGRPLFFLLAMSLLLPLPSRGAETASALALMPYPSSVKLGTGEFVVNNGFGITLEGYTEPRLERARQRFLTVLSRETGIPLWREAALNTPHFFIETAGPSSAIQQLGEDESYHLEILPGEVHLRAANPLGILHGLQTFLQLVHVTPQGFAAPAAVIDDHPRFPWRGLMIDVSRHFMPVEAIERNIDGMEAVKLNVLHWHLSDDQGFRVESRSFPLLQQKGSNGLYYTQDQIRSVIEYARDRGIRVVPEFDMPGHASSWFAGYPDLASGSGPYAPARTFGVFDPAMDPTRESTYQFLSTFIGEMAALFPDAYFHMGGDECNGKEWEANPRIRAFMQAHSMKTTADLQAYFTSRVEKIILAHGKVAEGWDEVLQPDTPQDVVIQSWRGAASLADAARRGYRVLLSAGYYLDLNQSAAEHYAVDPLAGAAAGLSPQQAKNILGGEAAMWTEFVSPQNLDNRIWPRTAAIAERLWSAQTMTDTVSMYDRLAIVSEKLDDYGLEHNRSYPQMLQRMIGDSDPASLRVLGDVMQPPRLYARHRLGQWDVFTPLNRLVDAVPPESDTARHFLDLVNTLVSGKATAQDWQSARQWLTLWRDNDAKLQPLLASSQLTSDLGPVSASLREVAATGLDAVGYLQSGRPAPAAWRTEQLAFLKEAARPHAVVVDMIAPAVAKLVDATRAQ